MAEAGIAESRIRLAGGPALLVSDRAGAGLPIVFLNSLAADLTMWSGVRERLPGRRTVAYDARGHGRSEVIAGDASVADLGRDALSLMDALGIERAILCGLSLGGITAMWMAQEAPDRVAGLALANTAVNFPPPQMWRERAEGARAGRFPELVEPTLERWLTAPFRSASPELAQTVRAMIAATPPEGYAAACTALAEADLTNALGGFGGPVLLVAGKHDQSTPVARAEEMKALLPQANLVELEAAHLSSVEAEADFADELERFVCGIEAGDHGATVLEQQRAG